MASGALATPALEELYQWLPNPLDHEEESWLLLRNSKFGKSICGKLYT